MNEFENIDPLKLLKLNAQQECPSDQNKIRKATVVYHSNCMDGFTAAWAFHRLVEIGQPEEYPGEISYIPMSYGDAPGAIKIPEFKDCDDLYILDFSFSQYELAFWASFFRKVILLDHHKTALENLGPENWPVENHPKNLLMILDMNRSGAGITWDYFSPKDRNTLVDYVEDRDLWKFKLIHSKEISAFIQMQERTFQSWDAIDYNLSREYLQTVTSGRLLLAQREQMVKEIAEKSRPITIDASETLLVRGRCVNCPPQFASEVGNYLVKEHDQIGVTYFQDHTGATRFSLRSGNDLEDVAKIAQAFGGGGHRNAAGFVMKDPNEKEEIVLTAGIVDISDKLRGYDSGGT